MRNIIKFVFVAFMMFMGIALMFDSCSTNDEGNESRISDSVEKSEFPENPRIETDFGELPGGYRTMDEYYEHNDRKVYHGYRKNLFPSGRPQTTAFYEHGEMMWYEKYDEVGNVLESGTGR